MHAAAKSLQSCPTLCDPIDGSPPGSPVPGILQAVTLEWVAISFSNEWKWKVKVKSLSRVWPSATPWTAAFQAPPSMGFSRQECWSGVPLPSLLAMHSLHQIYKSFFLIYLCLGDDLSVDLYFKLFLLLQNIFGCLRIGDHKCIGLCVGSLFCSIDLYFCFFANTMLSWWV